MSKFFDRLLGRTQEDRSLTVIPDAFKLQTASSTAGVTVNETSALAIATAYGCVRVLAESMAALPLHVYERREDGGRERRADHWLDYLLSVAPNPDMTAFEFKELLMFHLALRGNFYAEKVMRGNRVVALIPMHPDCVTIKRDGGSGQLIYSYDPHEGGSAVRVLPATHVMHIKGLSPNGLKGFSPLEVARETFGYSYATQQYGSTFFENGATPSGLLVHPGSPGPDARRNIKRAWEEQHSGFSNAHKVALMYEDIKYIPLSFKPEDSQFIEVRKLNRDDICAIFRVPPHMVANLDNANYSNIVQMDLAFAKHVLVPWCERIEQAIVKSLIPFDDQTSLYVEHNLSGIMRGDLKTRYESYGILWDRGIITANEIRVLENMNPIDEESGNIHWVPLNFTSAEKALSTDPPSLGGRPPEPKALPEPEEEKSCGCDHEQRVEDRSQPGAVRFNIQRSFVPVLEDAMRRIVRRETQSIRSIAKKESRSVETFEQKLTEFYSDTEYMRNQLRPAFTSLALALGPEITREVGRAWDYNDEVREWVEEYIDTFLTYYTTKSTNELMQLVRESQDELLEALESRLDEWESGGPSGTTRATKQAEKEDTRFGGAIAVMIGGLVGATAYRWQTIGKNCSYCNALNGRVVATNQPFVGRGEVVGEGDTYITVGHNVKHPPLHSACDCLVMLVIE